MSKNGLNVKSRGTKLLGLIWIKKRQADVFDWLTEFPRVRQRGKVKKQSKYEENTRRSMECGT